MLEFYQNLSLNINPNIFTLGSFSLIWYSVMYAVAFLTVYLILRFQIKKGKAPKEFSNDKDLLIDLLLASAAGLIIGARLGYVIFYDLRYFIFNPLEIIFPFSLNHGGFIGISGMSYYGGLIGGIIANIIFLKKKKLDFWKLADFVAIAIPAGFFWGRIGNFLNGELYGRATDTFLGMYFKRDSLGLLRHPSQLYEAFFEGIFLFIVLWFLRKKIKQTGQVFCSYLIGYALIRFFIEFFREPDAHLGLIVGFLSLGQLLSVSMLAVAVVFLLRDRSKLKFCKY